MALRAHQGDVCSVHLWNSSADNAPWITVANQRIAGPAVHGVAEVQFVNPASRRSEQTSRGNAGDDHVASAADSEPTGFTPSYWTDGSQNGFTYQPVSGYIGGDQFVVAFELHQGAAVASATLDVDVEVLERPESGGK